LLPPSTKNRLDSDRLLGLHRRSFTNSETRHVWVHVKGGKAPMMVSTDGVLNVYMLLKYVKQECPHILADVDVPLLQLYQSKEQREAPRECVFMLMVSVL
jgi:hypothetical protein